MAIGFSNTNKPLNPRGLDASPKGYNRAALYSGKALDFDGVNDSINCGDFDGASFGNGTTDTPCSIVSYFYLDDADRARVLGKHTEWVFGTNNLNEFNFSILDGTGTSNQIRRAGISALPFVGKWVHMVATYDGSSSSSGINVYINGVLSNGLAEDVGSYVATQNTSANVYVGLWSVDSRYLNGKVSGTKIFNTALTAAQVADLYNNPEKIVPTGVADSALKLWLPMQEGAGTTAYDGSGGGNHGTISGATWTHGIGAPVAQTAVIDWNKGQNLALYSEQIDNAAYLQSGAYSVSANATTAPDGKTTAEQITIPNTQGFYKQNISVSASTDYVFSFYVKKGTAYDARHNVYDNIGAANITAITSYISQTSTTEWNRIEVPFTTPAGCTEVGVYVDRDSAGNGTMLYWGFQLEQGTTAGPYVPTFGTAQGSDVLIPQGLTSGRDITGVNLFENVRKQGALNLDGNSWAEVHDNASLDITDEVSLETWYYHDTTTTNEGLLGRWNATTTTYLLLKNDTNVRFYTKSTSAINVNASVSTAGWHHVVGTYDGTTMRIYLDGSESATIGQTGSINTSTFPLEIGRYYSSQTYAQTGAIAQPRIYNRALTASEVLRNYNSGKSTYQ